MQTTAVKTARKSATVKIATVDAGTKPTPKKSAKALMRASNHRWAHAGVGVCIILSAVLNGKANYEHASVGSGVWAVMLGITIPALVFILARVAGTQWSMQSCINVTIRGTKYRFMLAIFTACMGAGLLGLSIHHCGDAISMLTGMSGWEGVLMAIAIDGGLVACELETVLG